jgi:hypothetical protein
MAIPNLVNAVESCRQRWPDAWANAHTNNSRTEEFIRLLASFIHYEIDERFGLNGKRANPNDISDDVLAYRGEGVAIDPETSEESPYQGVMEIIDVIGGAGGPNPQPQWGVAPGGPGDRGAWVKPARIHDRVSPGPVTPTPSPRPSGPVCPDPSAHKPKPSPVLPDRDELRDEGARLHAFYQAPNGLQRPNGLWIDGHPDWEGIGAWIFDVYLKGRMAGLSREDARALYVNAIQQSEEYRRLHGR